MFKFNMMYIAINQCRLRLVTSQGPPYPSRSPKAHPSGWTRTQGLSRRDSHAPPLFGTPPVNTCSGCVWQEQCETGRRNLRFGAATTGCCLYECRRRLTAEEMAALSAEELEERRRLC
jgi:hypothetical protein